MLLSRGWMEMEMVSLKWSLKRNDRGKDNTILSPLLDIEQLTAKYQLHRNKETKLIQPGLEDLRGKWPRPHWGHD